MNTDRAAKLSDAIAHCHHPRSDFRTAEAQAYTQRLRPFMQEAIFPRCRALDLGCSSGKFTFTMEQAGAAAVGIDCSFAALSFAGEIAAALQSRAEFIVGAFAQLPFRAESFDLILFPSNIVECSYDEMDNILRQAHRILRRGGLFCLEMQDGLEQFARLGWEPATFDLLEGRQDTLIQVPGAGAFAYETTFWTLSFAHFLASKYFRLLQFAKVDDKRYWLKYGKGIGVNL